MRKMGDLFDRVDSSLADNRIHCTVLSIALSLAGVVTERFGHEAAAMKGYLSEVGHVSRIRHDWNFQWEPA